MWMYEKWGHLVEHNKAPGDLRRWRSHLHEWAAAVQAKTGTMAFGKVVCFIDGTDRAISRPGDGVDRHFYDFQRIFYSGHKKKHCITFQGVMGVNGLFLDVWGACAGRHNDNWMVRRSGM